eukprot:TRINITY_DN23721_c0_g1_i1.p1 TRINITY_DN23721_c0_g1~~TRINITY_DN23721_c0_g1_i1.p1  ORF type:complete len:255 (-),score=76.90 TRINITY_DN23721_c0_g1_i1:448-1212(-)
MLRSLVGSEMCIRDSINAEYGNHPTPSMAFPHLDCCKFVEKQVVSALAKPLSQQPVSQLSRPWTPEEWTVFFNVQRRSLIGRQCNHWSAEFIGREFERVVGVLHFLGQGGEGGDPQAARSEAVECELSVLHDGWVHVLVRALKSDAEDMDLSEILDSVEDLALPCWQEAMSELELERAGMVLGMMLAYVGIVRDELWCKQRTKKFDVGTVSAVLLGGVHAAVRVTYDELEGMLDDKAKAEYDTMVENRLLMEFS